MSVREQIEDIFYSIGGLEFVDVMDYTGEVLDIVSEAIENRITQIQLDYSFTDRTDPDSFTDVDEYEAYAQMRELIDLREEMLE